MKKTIAISALMMLPVLSWGHGACGDNPEHCAYWHDASGVPVKDGSGACLKTPSWVPGTQVVGCDVIIPKDADGDGVPDAMDRCPGTAAGVSVGANGCPLDSDNDGVADSMDRCANTPRGIAVDAKGCPKDSDGDGVADSKDRCANTPRGVAVNAMGCPADRDGDGIADYQDACPDSKAGVKVDARGCAMVAPTVSKVMMEQRLDIKFASGSAVLAGSHFDDIEAIASVMKKDMASKVIIQGYTDSRGSAALNQRLSERRANAVVDRLVNRYGIERSRLTAVGYGKANPVASNNTAAGRAQNRRVIAVVKAMVAK